MSSLDQAPLSGSAAWDVRPSQWPHHPASPGAGTDHADVIDQAPITVCIAGSFAVDALEGPLRVWLDTITGMGAKVQLRWVRTPCVACGVVW